jgi:hypothetical protein
MRWRHTGTAEDRARAVRFAWTVSFLATLALVAILSLARSAQALSLTAPPSLAVPVALQSGEDEEEVEVEEEEFEEEECEDGEEECDRGSGSGDNGGGSSGGGGGGNGGGEAAPEAPRECLLSSARVTISASADKNRLRLLVHYSIASPAIVVVEYGLHGSKGSLFLGDARERFARRGALHLTKRLTDAQMAKVLAAKGFTVRLHVLVAPSYCHPFFERQLDVRSMTPRGLSWSQSP